MTPKSRTVLLGSPGPLAEGTLEGLLAGAGATRPIIDSVLVAGSVPLTDQGPLAIDRRDGLTRTAEAAGLEVIHTGITTDAGLRRHLTRIAPERVLVACLATILSPLTLACAPAGVYNVHPSALPHFRGPAPMFWQLRAGLEVGGVTVHRVERGIDTGPVCLRRPVPLPLGITEPAAEFEAGRRAGLALATSAMNPGAESPQRVSLGSYQSQPEVDDFRLDIRWSVERAARFIRGVRWRGGAFTVTRGAHRWTVLDVIEMHAPANTPQAPGEAVIPFRNGALRARVLTVRDAQARKAGAGDSAGA